MAAKRRKELVTKVHTKSQQPLSQEDIKHREDMLAGRSNKLSARYCRREQAVLAGVRQATTTIVKEVRNVGDSVQGNRDGEA